MNLGRGQQCSSGLTLRYVLAARVPLLLVVSFYEALVVVVKGLL